MKSKFCILLCSVGLLAGCCTGSYSSYMGPCCNVPNSNGASNCDFNDIATMMDTDYSCGYGCASTYSCNGCGLSGYYDTGRCSSCSW